MTTPTDRAATARTFALLALLLAIVAAVYWPGLTGGFVLDDARNIVVNPDVHVPAHADWNAWRRAAAGSPADELPRPLAMLTFAANHAATGLDPRPMKLTNLLVHLLNVLLVFACTRQLLRALPDDARAPAPRDDLFALAVAAAWGLHPINLMAVLYVVQRMESLAHVFVFAGLWSYLHGRCRQIAGRPGWGFVIAGLVGGSALGTLAKESALLLPLYALLAELIVLRGRGAEGRQPGLRGLHLVACVLPTLVVAAWLARRYANAAAYANRPFGLGERLLTEPRVLLDYLHWSVLPSLSRMGLYHDDYAVSHGLFAPPATALAIVALLALAAAAWWLRRRRPLVALGLAWFLAAQLLTGTFIPLELMFEHRNYFASFGVCLALADVLLRLPDTQTARRGGAALAVVLLLMFTATTHLRAREWSDPMRFAASEAQKHPASPRATYALAAQLVALTRYEPDSPYDAAAREAIAGAVAVSGDSVMAEQAGLIHAARTGRALDPAWWQGMESGLQALPADAGNLAALDALGRCAAQHQCNFPTERMLGVFEAALSRRPNAYVLTMYAHYAEDVLGDPGLALRLWKDAATRAPGDAHVRIELATLLLALGQDAEAQRHVTALRSLGRFGTNVAAADALQAEIDRRRAAAKPR
jgi:hypothetical protein